jgi:hypothetical protein
MATLLEKLKRINQEYMISNEDRKLRILTASKFVLDKLEALGLNRSFLITYILYGDEFTLSEYGKTLEQLTTVDKC